MKNLILNTDSYKASHFAQYPQGAEFVSSYIESRGGVYSETLFFGLQAFIKEYLTTPITAADIDEADAVFTAHGVPFNRAGWEYILETYNGYLPLEIQAVKEGTMLPTGNVMVQVINTDPKCAWLTSYIETALLRAVWYPTTVATVSKECRNIIARYMEDTAGSTDGIEFKLHDFGARGASSEETAALGGAAHLVNFSGTDTLSGIIAARRAYGVDMAGFSIPAAEHSTITSWGKDGESDAYANMIAQFGGEGRLVAVVSDSYDIWNAIDNIWGGELKEQVETMGGTLVVRPDSGEPVEIVPEAIERLMAKFGYRVNAMGYRVLPDCVRLIQGDGVNAASIAAILDALKVRKISAENIAFGMGGELLQKVNRDTQKFAMKASAISINGQWRDVYKDPITDPGKRSKRGRLALVRDDEGYQTVRESELGNRQNELITVYRNGDMLNQITFDEIRARAAQQ
ncbi:MULTISPECIES: nicotinate phosphoribosyltransferase [Thalassolituus]|uniref:nicotinate phosphoribosyltransferase n=1 Tax=Thalassolituus TaxID=187492 RepID=UPI0026483E79|nr:MULTISPECIES: nicotinate phosphoribosyltransferase [Thalassolituus]|tara:strand:- start:2225 stop:3601 length:1377 start_codon:yes stop_codon:yes gene_type:complete